MIVKMLLTLDFDPATGEYKSLKQEIVKEEVKTRTVKEEVPETSEPQITLDPNKYILNKAAAQLMGVAWEDRLSIKYQKIDGITFPVIGTDEAFGTKGGNKLTKSLSVSCRGKANDMLRQYGDTFTVTTMKGQDDLFVLVGNTERPEEPEVDNIEVLEDESDNIDLPLDTEIRDESAKEIDPLTFEL